jgi:DNA polymerase kappa
MEKNGKNEEQLEEKLNYVFTAEKAGMEGLDKDKIAEIIYETTKNSRIFKKNEEDLKLLKDEIDKINKELESFHKQEILYQQVKNKADSRLNFLKNQIRFDKIWMHLDMDMFYAAVEIRDDPSLANIPMCVGNKSMISTSNYIARKYGVRSAMPGFIAEKLCPNLKFVPGNFEKYHIESEKIMNVIMEYDENYESMGLDEAYVDLTNYCFENNIKTEEDIIKLGKEIKKKIFDSTKLTSSIGIAANKTLAKICSDYNKPDGLYFLKFNQNAILEFMKPMNIRKIPFIGNKTEKRLNYLNIFKCEDLLNRYVDLYYLDEESFDFYMKNCYGIGSYKHRELQDEKSISRSHSFKMNGDITFLKGILENLTKRVLKNMERIKVNCKTITIEVINITEKKKSKGKTNSKGYQSGILIFDTAYDLLKEILNESLKIRMLRVKVSGLIKYEEENEKSKKVSSYFENLKDAYQKQIKERNVMNEIKDDKQLNLNKSKSNNITKNSLNDKKKSKGKKKLSVPCTDILKLLENMKSKKNNC